MSDSVSFAFLIIPVTPARLHSVAAGYPLPDTTAYSFFLIVVQVSDW